MGDWRRCFRRLVLVTLSVGLTLGLCASSMVTRPALAGRGIVWFPKPLLVAPGQRFWQPRLRNERLLVCLASAPGGSALREQKRGA